MSRIDIAFWRSGGVSLLADLDVMVKEEKGKFSIAPLRGLRRFGKAGGMKEAKGIVSLTTL